LPPERAASAAIAPSGGAKSPGDDDLARQRLALRIWEQAQDPVGTFAEKYLRSRGLDLPEAAGRALRFHPECPFGAETHSAMVAVVVGIHDNRFRGIQRTALTPVGGALKRPDKHGKMKTLRMSLGATSGGCVKLSPDEDVGAILGVAEGVESALAMRAFKCFGASPVWSLIWDGGLKRFPVLDGIEALWIGVDDDPPGIAAAEAVSQRWLEAGREVFKMKARAKGLDLNDVVRGRLAS
jgi:putative DNA primase/helicase